MQIRRGWERGDKGWKGRSNVWCADGAHHRRFVRKALDYMATGQLAVTEVPENGSTGAHSDGRRIFTRSFPDDSGIRPFPVV